MEKSEKLVLAASAVVLLALAAAVIIPFILIIMWQLGFFNIGWLFQ